MDAFVYGTLRDPARAREVLGRAEFDPDARLVGLGRASGRYPTLVPGGETEGRVLRLEDGDLAALDAYEGVDRGLYVRATVPAPDGRVSVYVGDPVPLGAPADWPGEGAFADRVERYVERNPVSIRRDG